MCVVCMCMRACTCAVRVRVRVRVRARARARVRRVLAERTELRRHHDEAEGVDGARERRQQPRVPALVRVVPQRVDRVATDQGVRHPLQLRHDVLVVLLGAAHQRVRISFVWVYVCACSVCLYAGLYACVINVANACAYLRLRGVRGTVLVREHRDDAAPLDIHDHRLGHFPDLDHEADALADQDHPGGVVVEEIEEDDDLHRAVGEQSADREALHRLVVPPEADVCRRVSGQD